MNKLQEEVNKHGWFHSINLNDEVITPGRFAADVVPNWTLFGTFSFLESINLRSLNCIDIGTFDGITSFIMKNENAQNVDAVDIFDRPTFHIARKALDLDVKYTPNVGIEMIPKVFEDKKFDVVVLAGVLYHLYSPLQGLVNCRKIMTNGSILIIETEVCHGEESVMNFNTGHENYFEPYTYWRPTVKCLKDMLKFCCFNIIAEISTKHRYTILAEAVKPSEVQNKTSTLKSVHNQTNTCSPEYLNFSKLQDEDEKRHVEFKITPREKAIIEPEIFKTRFSIHPQK